MKKRLLSFVAIQAVALLIGAFSIQSFGQSSKSCSAGLHEAFGPASTKKPVLLRRLGTSPQFGEIPQHTSKSAYDHLKKVHSRNLKGSKREIDNFLAVLGYSGFNDPAFTLDKITPAILPKGKIGWMGGYSRGHQYKWSILGNPFPTFKILSKDGTCHAYIMKKCGNAFYDPSERQDCPPCTPCDPNYNDKTKCPECLTQELSFAGTGSIKAGDVVNTTKTLPIVASYNGKKLCIGEQTVPVRLTYELTADGKVDYARTFQVCDYGTNAPTSLNMPVQLAYNISESNITLGQALDVPLTKKQYKKMKKLYAECPAGTGEATTEASTLVANKISNFSEASTAPALATNIKTDPLNCVKQTLTLIGSGELADASVNAGNQEITLIGKYIKDGKLKKGETAEKYRCLGTYNLPANSQIAYNLTGNSKIEHIIDVCDTGNVNPNEAITVPMTLNTQFTKQDLMVGDYGKVLIPLTKKEYKRVSKLYSRCCGDGTTKCF
jgi:hypothetical protein